jgi:hypothetical protein
MKEQAISFEPPIHILCHHPLVSQIIEKTLALSGAPLHPLRLFQLKAAGQIPARMRHQCYPKDIALLCKPC